MFKSAKWRSEKNKIKAIFKLQFHATQVLQSGVDTLALSLVPVDVGKPSVRLQSTKVQDGSCRWENPVCENVKFIQEAKTGKITEKLYHVVVSKGSHETGLFGEVSLNFADYAETTKPSSVSLPLNSSHNSAVLHVLIQKLPENVDQREQEDCDDAKRKSHGRSLQTYLSTDDPDESNQRIVAEDTSAKAITGAVELNVDCRSSSGSEMTLSSSESTSSLDPREISQRNSSIRGDTNGFLSPLSEHSELKRINLNASTSPIEEHKKRQWEWFTGSDHGLSTDNLANSFHGGLLREKSGPASDSQIEKLKAEIAILVRQVDISELELQTLRKQIVKESRRAQDLSKEVVALKEERDNHKSECERLGSFQKRMEEAKVRNKSQFLSGDLKTLVEEIREELDYEKELTANLRIQLQKTQESNAELMLAVRDLDEMLVQKNKEISNLSNKLELKENAPDERNNDDEEQKALEKLVRAHSNMKETYLLEQKIIDLYSEIEIYRRDKDELEMQMEQLALDYEILKQENHDITYKLEQSQLQEQLNMQYDYSPACAENDFESIIMSLENELRLRSEELSDSLATTKELQNHVKTLEEELDEQAQGFAVDLESLTLAKVEQEQRAIRAEEALRQTRSKNASTAERLQEEFRRLSMLMASTFDANEKVAMKAMTEANELHAQKYQLEEMLREVKEELHAVNADYEVKLHELSCQIDTKTLKMKDMLLEIEEKSKQLESQKKHEKEVCMRYSDEIKMLKAEIQRLEAKILCLTEQIEQNEKLKADLESMRQSVEEGNASIQRGNALQNELVRTTALFKKETQKSAEELNKVKQTNDEKERMVKFLTSELEDLRVECKASLFENEVEREKLWKLVVQLKDDLKKKDVAFANIDRKFKDSNERRVLSDGTKTSPKNKKYSIRQTPKEVSGLRVEVKMLEDLIKLKETDLETSSSSFLEKEKELQHKIEELESRIEKLSQSCPLQPVVEEERITAANDGMHATAATTIEFTTATTCSAAQNEDTISLDIRTDGSSREPNGSITKHGDGNCGDIIRELASLKDKNKEMESELKEMQGRYSEISLKFAEVEGQRQRLMMTVRTLKNARKS